MKLYLLSFKGYFSKLFRPNMAWVLGETWTNFSFKVNYNFRIAIALGLTLFLLRSQVALAEKFVPHYASIKSSEVNVRKGPNARYKIVRVYKKKGEPVEIIGEFEHWKRIRDIDGDEGWVRSSMLSKKRGGIVIVKESLANLYRNPASNAKVFVKIQSNKRVFIEQCKKEYCKIKVNNIVGWIERQYLWGIYANENF
jgi:SH3-like domain-containing protein